MNARATDTHHVQMRFGWGEWIAVAGIIVSPIASMVAGQVRQQSDLAVVRSELNSLTTEVKQISGQMTDVVRHTVMLDALRERQIAIEAAIQKKGNGT